jgi:hypothetical protein
MQFDAGTKAGNGSMLCKEREHLIALKLIIIFGLLIVKNEIRTPGSKQKMTKNSKICQVREFSLFGNNFLLANCFDIKLLYKMDLTQLYSFHQIQSSSSNNLPHCVFYFSLFFIISVNANNA